MIIILYKNNEIQPKLNLNNKKAGGICMGCFFSVGFEFDFFEYNNDN